MTTPPPIRLAPDSVTLSVRVRPGSRVEAIEGVVSGELRVRLRARPVEGAANAALVALLAKVAGVPRSSVTILSGATSRSKVVRIETPDPHAAARLVLDPPG